MHEKLTQYLLSIRIDLNNKIVCNQMNIIGQVHCASSVLLGNEINRNLHQNAAADITAEVLSKKDVIP